MMVHILEREKSDPKTEFSSGPRAPAGTRGMLEYTTLASMRDALTNEHIDLLTTQEIDTIIERWRNDPNTIEPFAEMQSVLERVRKIPRGDKRVILMNSIVRTLGRPDTLATFLDMLRDSATRHGTKERELCRLKLQNVKMHSIYGWCGNTLVVESFDQPTEGTYKPIPPGLGERLGNSTSAWNLTVHIWQPNLTAKGFPVNTPLEKGALIEPPHSHPFDFVSTVVRGAMYQSIYAQNDDVGLTSTSSADRYSETALEHVDGVWPPHYLRETRTLKTLEHRVLLKEGDSYHMLCDWIHDVEIDGNIAASKPTITLFLSRRKRAIITSDW
ncbi:MAG: hypothetical protein ACYCPH_01360 [Minisyncoccota bacterium]